MVMEVNCLGVLGAGQMGAGIAQVAALSGMPVFLVDVTKSALDKAKEGIVKSLERLQKKQRIDANEASKVLSGIQFSCDLGALSHCNFVIEAVPEEENLKKKVIEKLDEILVEEAIIASNTSSISITRLARITKRPHLVVGMHFMNPVPIMKLVEIIRGLATNDRTFNVTRSLAEKMGKVITHSKDQPGFIANRILMPMINEAFFALHEGVADASDIDATMKLGAHHPMGPLALADFIGLDTCLSILEVLHHGFGDSKYRPCPLLRQYVDAGWVGRKSGKGVFEY